MVLDVSPVIVFFFLAFVAAGVAGVVGVYLLFDARRMGRETHCRRCGGQWPADIGEFTFPTPAGSPADVARIVGERQDADRRAADRPAASAREYLARLAASASSARVRAAAAALLADPRAADWCNADACDDADADAADADDAPADWRIDAGDALRQLADDIETENASWRMATGRRAPLEIPTTPRPVGERRYIPTPHIVDGRNYTVVDSPQAYMGRGASPVMGSPHAPADVGRVLALHEEAHAKFTPDFTPADVVGEIAAKYIDADDYARRAALYNRPDACSVVNVCEDTRINAKLQKHLGIGVAQWEPVIDHFARLGHSRAPRFIKEAVNQCRKSKDGLGALLSLLPLRSHPSADALLKAPAFVRRYASSASSTERAILTRVVNLQRRLFASDATFEETKTVADIMLRAAFDLESLWGREEETARAAELGETAADDASIERTASTRVAESGTGRGSVKWCPMRTESPDRPQRIPTPRYRSRMRATDSGAILRYPARVCVDGSVFSMKRRMPGGTLLIDVSGSMSLSADAIDALISSAPLATIAIYSGDGVRGILRVIAKDGSRMRADAFKSGMGGGNCVDGPALDWLVRQSEPRVWVCDGAVTGVGDNSDPHLTASAFATARVGRVVRVPTASDAIDAFASPRKLADYIRARFNRPE